MATQHAPPVPGSTTEHELAEHTAPLSDLDRGRLSRVRATQGFSDEAEPKIIDDRYEVLERVGVGGMGVVYRVIDTKLGVEVALKLVRSRYDGNASRLRAKLDHEAKSMAQLRAHPNVVGLYETGTHMGRSYFTMEYVQGKDLRRWCCEEVPSTEDIIRVYVDAARGLKAAHDLHIIHRDFKPENVLVSADGVAKVADFGVAAVTREIGHREGATRGWALAGTRPYMPPEQLRAEQPDARSDQFAFCVSLWESLTGMRPFSWSSLEQQEQTLNDPPRAADKLPSWLRRVLARGLAGNPGDRYPDMGKLITLLERGLDRPRRRRQALAGSIAALAVSGVTMLTSLMLASEPQTCERYVDSISLYWGPQQRAALEARRSEAPASVAYALDRLDELSQQWVEASQASCIEDQAPPPDDPSRACLERWLESLTQAVNLLAQRGDTETLTNAPRLLQALVPPAGDYCALDQRPVEVFVRQHVALARGAALLGNNETANQASREAIERAQEISKGERYTNEGAAAHAVRGEILIRQGQLDEGLAELRLAEAQALGTNNSLVLANVWLFWAKSLAQNCGPTRDESTRDESHAREAQALLDRAKPLLDTLELPPSALPRGEYLEASALTHAAFGRYEQALAGHREAAKFFLDIGYPLEAARSTYNGGVALHWLEDLKGAERAYRESLDILERAEVPPSFPSLLEVQFNLGVLLQERIHTTNNEVEIQVFAAAGFRFLDEVIEHAPPKLRLEALAVATQLAAGLLLPAPTRGYAERTLAALAQPGLDPATVDMVTAQVGLSLVVGARDPQGERIVRTLLERGADLDPGIRSGVLRTWVEYLEEEQRCDELRAQLAAIDDIDDPALAKWAAARTERECHDLTSDR